MCQHLVRVLRRHVGGDGRNHLGGRGCLGLFRVDDQTDGAVELGVKGVDVDIAADPFEREFGQNAHAHTGLDHGEDRLVIDGEAQRVGPNLVVVQRRLGVLVVVAPLQDEILIDQVGRGHRRAVGGDEVGRRDAVDLVLDQRQDGELLGNG